VPKAKSGPTVSAKRFFFVNNDERFPRVEVTVDGYFFGFTCDSKLTPRIVTDTHAHGSGINARAYAVAAGLFAAKLVANDSGGYPRVRQPSLL
jgi:hypothetical protein